MKKKPPVCQVRIDDLELVKQIEELRSGLEFKVSRPAYVLSLLRMAVTETKQRMEQLAK